MRTRGLALALCLESINVSLSNFLVAFARGNIVVMVLGQHDTGGEWLATFKTTIVLFEQIALLVRQLWELNAHKTRGRSAAISGTGERSSSASKL